MNTPIAFSIGSYVEFLKESGLRKFRSISGAAFSGTGMMFCADDVQ